MWNIAACFILLECYRVVSKLPAIYPSNVTSGYSKVAYYVGGYCCVIWLSHLSVIYVFDELGKLE